MVTTLGGPSTVRTNDHTNDVQETYSCYRPGGYIIFRSQHLDLTHPNVRRS